MSWESLRLVKLPAPGKLLVTFFLLLVGVGYLSATANIFFKHQDDDLEPGLTINDLKRSFHGLEKEVNPEATRTVNSTMLEQVREGGEMHKHLERGGEAAIRSLITWLEAGAEKGTFTQGDLSHPGDPSAAAVITKQCLECHNTEGGEAEDYAFADTATSDPEYQSVWDYAEPEITVTENGPQIVNLKPISLKQLVQVTHVHILAIPSFVFLTGMLFLLTGFDAKIKLILVPLPILATILDIGGWWLARVAEPAIFMIGAAGAIFGTSFALQIIGIFVSMWFGKKEKEEP